MTTDPKQTLRGADLKALRALCDAATDGGWVTDLEEHEEPYQTIKIKACGRLMDIGSVWQDDVCFDLNGEQIANARFIAATDPTTVRALIDEIERLRAALSAITKHGRVETCRDAALQALKGQSR